MENFFMTFCLCFVVFQLYTNILPILKIWSKESEQGPKDKKKKESGFQLLRVIRVNEHSTIPSRGTPGSVGYDLYSSVDTEVPIDGKQSIDTGLIIVPPSGYHLRIISKSGLSLKNDIEVNAGLIDGDYRGHLIVVLRNHSKTNAFQVTKGDKIAQFVIQKTITFPIIEIQKDDAGNLLTTKRGTGGFGSTGKTNKTNTRSEKDTPFDSKQR